MNLNWSYSKQTPLQKDEQNIEKRIPLAVRLLGNNKIPYAPLRGSYSRVFLTTQL